MRLSDEVQAIRKRVRLIVGLLSLLFALWLAAGFATSKNGAIQQRPLRKDQLIQALQIGGVSSSEYVQRIRSRGVDFKLTPAIERELRAAGASSAMIEAIRANYHAPVPLSTPKPTPRPSAPSTTRAASVPHAGAIIRNQMGMEFGYVPAGTFMMGSTDAEAQAAYEDMKRYWNSEATLEMFSREKPKHQVTIREGFYMGRYEVTQAQWQQVMGNNPSRFKDCGQCPVELVAHVDIQEFIRKLNATNDGYTYRLPSEAQWEYAARAGTTTVFAFGDSLTSEQANFDGNYPYGGAAKGVNRGKTMPVGSYQPNAWGLYDMHGNVLELCEDWYHDNYNGAPSDGSAWLSGGDQNYLVLRGGSWAGNGYSLRSAARDRLMSGFRSVYIGFRLVAFARPS
ncbi:MAG TPA: formylglycine-generating enzyme family protein [Pyrinomonadaceae bacterium]